MSRNIGKFARPDLWKTLQSRVYCELGLDIRISCVDRTFDEQAAYWAQGREPLEFTNNLRKIAGLPPISKAENKRKITWTWNSKHLTNMNDEDPKNDKSRAIDYFIQYDGKAIWDLKADVNKDQLPDYYQIADIAEELGFICGIRWKNQDPVHIEIPEELINV